MSVVNSRSPSPRGKGGRIRAPAPSTRLSLAASIALATAATPSVAHALPSSVAPVDEAPSQPPSTTAPPEKEAPDKDTPPSGSNDRFRIGALAGVGFPRPLSVEAMAKLGGYVAVGAEYGVLPAITIDGVSTSSWAATGDLRVFPFHGMFFVGFRAGYQHIDASATASLAGVGSASASASLDSWIVNPRIGLLYTSRAGISIGVEAGLQLAVGSTFSTTLPAALALQVRQSTPVQTLSGALPTVDLLRIGMLF
jgi:hypothetical protein